MLRSMIAAALAFAVLASAGTAAAAKASQGRFNEVSLCDNNGHCVINTFGQGGVRGSLSHKAVARVARAAKARTATIQSAAEVTSSNYCHEDTAAGPITIACWLAPNMKGFISDAVARGFRGPVHCLSYSRSHVAHSLHFIAEACDFAQRGWGRTVAVMYHVNDLAKKWGLRNGCSFGDCGHIDSGRTGYARAETRNLYAAVASFKRHRRHIHMARR